MSRFKYVLTVYFRNKYNRRRVTYVHPFENYPSDEEIENIKKYVEEDHDIEDKYKFLKIKIEKNT